MKRMQLFVRYFLLEFKNSLIVARKSLISFLLILLVTLGGVYFISYTFLEAKLYQKVEIGLVIASNGRDTKLATQLVAAMDSVKSICNFQYLEEEKALDALTIGTLQAVIVLPSDFLDNVYLGNNILGTIYFPTNMNLNTKVFKELLFDGISLARISEAGILSSYEVAASHLKENTTSKNSTAADETQHQLAALFDTIAASYNKTALGRDNLFDEVIVSAFGDVDLYQFFYSSALITYLLMLGVHFSFLYQKQCRAVEQKLVFYGLNKVGQSVIKILVMSCYLWALQLLIYAVSCMISYGNNFMFLYYDSSALFGFLLIALVLSVYFHIVYSLFSSRMENTLLLLCFNLVLLLGSGLFLPVSYLPSIMQKISPYLPMAYWHLYSQKLLFTGATDKEHGMMLCILLIELSIGAILLRKNLRLTCDLNET